MKTEHIEVVDYDSKWVNDFNQIKGEIEEALKQVLSSFSISDNLIKSLFSINPNVLANIPRILEKSKA